jgi:hypothetical protein
MRKSASLRTLFMTAVFAGLTLLPFAASAQTYQYQCIFDTSPAGWIKVDLFYSTMFARCGTSIYQTANTAKLEQYSNKAIGATMGVCISTYYSPTPAGWQNTGYYYFAGYGVCGSSPSSTSPNMRTIQRVS